MERTLAWVLATACMLVACSHAFLYGAFHYIYENDVTKISLFLTSVLVWKTIQTGWATWSFENQMATDGCSSGVLERIEEMCNSLFYWEGKCVQLGLLGTIIGFILINREFLAVLEMPNYNANQATRILAPGNGVALTTTLVGMASSLLLLAQERNLQLLARSHEGDVHAENREKEAR